MDNQKLTCWVWWIIKNSLVGDGSKVEGLNLKTPLSLKAFWWRLIDTILLIDDTGNGRVVGGRGCNKFVPVLVGNGTKIVPNRGHILPIPWPNVMNSGQACRPCRGSCSSIPGRDCFGNLPGDEIVVSPPSPIVEPLRLIRYYWWYW